MTPLSMLLLPTAKVFTLCQLLSCQCGCLKSTSLTLTWNQYQKIIEHSDMFLARPWHRIERRQLTVRTIPLHMTFLLTCRTDDSWTLHTIQSFTQCIWNSCNVFLIVLKQIQFSGDGCLPAHSDIHPIICIHTVSVNTVIKFIPKRKNTLSCRRGSTLK